MRSSPSVFASRLPFVLVLMTSVFLLFTVSYSVGIAHTARLSTPAALVNLCLAIGLGIFAVYRLLSRSPVITVHNGRLYYHGTVPVTEIELASINQVSIEEVFDTFSSGQNLLLKTEAGTVRLPISHVARPRERVAEMVRAQVQLCRQDAACAH
jgi:hypothetical protein